MPFFAHYSGHTHTDTQEKERGRMPKEDWREGKTKARAFLLMAFLGLHFSRSTEDTKYPEKLSLKKSTEIFHYLLKDQMCQWVGRNEGRVKSIKLSIEVKDRLLLHCKIPYHTTLFSWK